MEGMSKTVLVVGSIAAAMLLACMAAVPGASQTVTLVGAGDIAGCDFKADRKTARLLGRIRGTVFTPDCWARLYWEKPRSSLSWRSMSGFLEAVLILFPSPIAVGAEISLRPEPSCALLWLCPVTVEF
jgi:hypothetical protein